MMASDDGLRGVRAMSGWMTVGEPPGGNVDEFASPGDVARALESSADAVSLLGIQHPHRTVAARRAGLGLADVLPRARDQLQELRRRSYRPVRDVVVPYRVSGPPDGTAFGVLCLVDPAALDRDGHPNVRHGEDVYPRVVQERAAVLAGLRCATSAAMLVPTSPLPELGTVLADITSRVGDPVVCFTDERGRSHEMWQIDSGTDQESVMRVVNTGPLLVADGNHRIAAAREAGLGGMLALITDGPDLRIGALHRVVHGVSVRPSDFEARCRSRGLVVRPSRETAPPAGPGRVVVCWPEAAYVVEVSDPDDEELVGRDYGFVEQVIIGEVLGVDPGGRQVRCQPESLLSERAVPADADVVVLLAALPYGDVQRASRRRQPMPRKSTYFTPKPRSGLFLADLGECDQLV